LEASPTSVVDNGAFNTREDNKNVASDFQHQRGTDSDSLLRVQVESSIQKTTFYVPVSLMLQREVEMQESAKQTQISPERWSSSRLYSLWKSSERKSNGGEITLRLEPEEVMKDYSELQWKPWLTACIREYYNTGNIRIPDDCLGSDILLALEYFGILTSSPDTFTFNSAQALGRIKLWSAYFSHRNAIAEWVLSDFRSCLGSSRTWITTSNPEEGNNAETLLQVNGGTAMVLGGENDARATSSIENLPSCHVIHYLFFDNESANKVSRDTPTRMRRDFCDHLCRQLDPLAAKVSFDVERVKITKSSGHITTALRAVLRLQLSQGGKHELSRATKGENSRRDHSKNISEESESLDRGRQRLQSSQSSSRARGHKATTAEESFGSEDSELVRMVQVESSENDGGYSPHGEGTEDNLSKALSDSIIKVDEQRHPYRSTPPPEEKRTSPEGVHKESIQSMANSSLAKQKITADQESLQPIVPSGPIGYVNTAFGDLQSVTSALSDPYMDDSTVGSISSRFLVKLARKRLQPIENRQMPTRGYTESPVAPELYEEPAQPSEVPQNRFHADGAFKLPEKHPKEVESSNDKVAPECNIWEGIIGTMCGDQLPAAQSTALEGHKESEPEYDFFSEVLKNASMDVQASKDWLESTFAMEHPPAVSREKKRSSPRGGLTIKNDASVAQSASRSRSRQFDDFEPSERPDRTRPRSKVQSDDGPERFPREVQSRSSPNYSRESRLVPDTACPDESSSASSDPAPPRRISSTRPREQRHHTSTPESDLIVLKNRRQSEIHRAKTSALAIHTSRSLKPSERHDVVELPPREPRRARVRGPIARRKNSSSIAGQAPVNPRSATSKAKVHPSGSSRLFQKESSSTMESLPDSRSSRGRKMLL
jgi:hypothetical protein